jgi:beta-lactamase superfamily II metal-dependent hydrolase
MPAKQVSAPVSKPEPAPPGVRVVKGGLTFTFLDAAHGDACLITWPDGDRLRTMLIDGGPGATYDDRILPHLAAHRMTSLDVTCVTHIDDDHIGGVIRMLTAIDRARTANDPEPVQVRSLWFNNIEDLVDSVEPALTASTPPDQTTDAVLAASYRQGRELQRLSARLRLTGNPPFNGPIHHGTTATIGGLHVTAVTPTQEALERLADRWRRAQRLRLPEVTAAGLKDYSVPNLSSITLYLHHNGRTALLTGDARGDHILDGLANSGIHSPGTPLHVDVLKLPHHGSAKNVTPAFFEHLTADHYVISTNGHRQDHPDPRTLRWLVESRTASDGYTVHLTNPVPRALDTLRELQRNRAFRINVQTQPATAITIPT